MLSHSRSSSLSVLSSFCLSFFCFFPLDISLCFLFEIDVLFPQLRAQAQSVSLEYLQSKDARKSFVEIAFFDTSAGTNKEWDATSVVLFHPFENLLYAADTKNTIAVWDYKGEVKGKERVNLFCNENNPGTRITTLATINDFMGESALLMCGSDDGIVRLWRNPQSDGKQQLATAWVINPPRITTESSHALMRRSSASSAMLSAKSPAHTTCSSAGSYQDKSGMRSMDGAMSLTTPTHSYQQPSPLTAATPKRATRQRTSSLEDDKPPMFMPPVGGTIMESALTARRRPRRPGLVVEWQQEAGVCVCVCVFFLLIFLTKCFPFFKNNCRKLLSYFLQELSLPLELGLRPFVFGMCSLSSASWTSRFRGAARTKESLLTSVVW